MEQQTFDDGTVITYAADGTVASYTTTGGQTFSPDRSIFGQFVDTLGRGVNFRLEQALGLVPAPASSGAAPSGAASAQAPAMTAMLMWGAVALGVYFLLRKV